MTGGFAPKKLAKFLYSQIFKAPLTQSALLRSPRPTPRPTPPPPTHTQSKTRNILEHLTPLFPPEPSGDKNAWSLILYEATELGPETHSLAETQKKFKVPGVSQSKDWCKRRMAFFYVFGDLPVSSILLRCFFCGLF